MNLKFLNKDLKAILIFLSICIVYLFPFFTCKVDTPTDIRNIRMYPWRYHALDKKIKKITLWKAVFPSENNIFDPETKSNIFNLKVPPGNTSTIVFKLDLNNTILKALGKLSDGNYFVNFDFKTLSNKSVAYDLGILLVNNLTGASYTPGVAVAPTSGDKISPWYKTLFPLNNFLQKLKSVEDLKSYSLKIVIKNKNKTSLCSICFQDLKIDCEDFSSVRKVHNHYNNDLIQMFTPFREYFSESLKKGRLPFWNNYIFGGTEFLAEPQVGYFHPLYFLSYLVFEHFTAHFVITFICLFLSGVGAFLLSQHWGLSSYASLLAGLVYMFNPFNVTWFSYEHMLMNSAALPFLLLFYEKNIKDLKLINKYLIFCALILGLIFISGHLQYVYYTVIFFALFVFFKFVAEVVSTRLAFKKHVFSFIFVFLFGLLLGSIVLIPFFPLFYDSHRAPNPASLVKATSVPISAFLGLIYPFYKGYPEWPLSGVLNTSSDYINFRSSFARNYVYFGFLPFIFSLFSLRLVFKNKLILFFTFSIFVSLLICTGSPVFFWIRNYLIGFKEMQHYRFLQIYSYSVPFLCGFGFQIILNYFSFLKENIRKLLFGLILVITVLDLMYFSSYFVTWSNRDDYKPVPKGGSLEYLITQKEKSKEPFRVLPFISHKVEGSYLKVDVAEPNTLLPYKLEDASGYSSFIPKDIYYTLFYIQTMDSKKLYTGEIFDLFSNINTPYPISNFHSKILDLLNAKYFLVPNFLTIDSPKVKKVYSGDCNVYENKDVLPRAFVVPDFKVISSAAETILELDSETFNPRKEVILMTCEEPSALPPKAAALNYSVDFLKYEQDNITLMVGVNSPGFLVLGNNLSDNWKVKINGREGKHLQANLLQRAVFLPGAGNYLVEFYYFPKLFLIGLLVSGLALTFLVLMAIYLKIKQV